jgi:hypothetical protein
VIDRQEIIESSINVENLVSMLITHHFFPVGMVNMDFMHIVMCDSYATTGFKVSVLAKCYPSLKKDLINKLSRLFSIRNIFAHSGLAVSRIADPDADCTEIMSAKHRDQPLDFEALRNEFLLKAREVELELFLLIQATGLKPIPADKT